MMYSKEETEKILSQVMGMTLRMMSILATGMMIYLVGVEMTS